MSTKMNVSKLERVPLREAWKHDAVDGKNMETL